MQVTCPTPTNLPQYQISRPCLSHIELGNASQNGRFGRDRVWAGGRHGVQVRTATRKGGSSSSTGVMGQGSKAPGLPVSVAPPLPSFSLGHQLSALPAPAFFWGSLPWYCLPSLLLLLLLLLPSFLQCFLLTPNFSPLHLPFSCLLKAAGGEDSQIHNNMPPHTHSGWARHSHCHARGGVRSHGQVGLGWDKGH